MSNRTRRRAPKAPPAVRTQDYRQLRHPYTPAEIFSADRVEYLHETALRILEELGLLILLDEARDLYKAGGALVDEGTMMVRIGREMVEAALQTAPPSFKLAAGSRERDHVFELGSLTMTCGAGCPNANDRERGRRPGSMEDYLETIKLQQSFDAIGKLGPAVEPQDVPIHLRHYAQMEGQMTLSDKPLFIYSRGSRQVDEAFEMIRLARQIDQETFESAVMATTIINTNSPRQIDKPMAQGIIDFARAKQLSVITPFCLSGAMAPVTIAGALALQHAEALAGIVLSQLARAGAPVAYGGFASNVDMKSGAPAFGTPEHIQACIGSGQLARHIGLPWRSASGAASNIADGQGAQETALALWGAFMSGATLIVHSAGWLEGGLTFGYEKFIVDMEAVNTIAELCNPVAQEDDDFAFRAIADVQPGGHFFATDHTMERYQTAFYPPVMADLSNFGQWEEAGAKTADERATAIWKETLATFTPPPSCAGVAERLAPFIEERTKAGGAPPLD
ncbi:MAG: trimethylamine methyltransferase family protein [Pseudomonadota bacterium]